MNTPTPAQHAELARFHKDWHQAAARLEMATRSLQGAQNDATLKEARFKGAAEFLFGSAEVGFAYDETKDTLTFTQPNRAARRKKK